MGLYSKMDIDFTFLSCKTTLQWVVIRLEKEEST